MMRMRMSATSVAFPGRRGLSSPIEFNNSGPGLKCALDSFNMLALYN